MKSKVDKKTSTEFEITVTATGTDLAKYKKDTLERLKPEVSAPGFRKGKAPSKVVETQVDDNYLNSQLIDGAINGLLGEVIKDNNLRPVSSPNVEVKKYVPGSVLEFTVLLTVVPPIKLGSYKSLKTTKNVSKVTEKDINDVLENLRTRTAQKTDVKRKAHEGDEAWIDFSGKDKDGNEIAGAKGTDYPLLLGSNTFIKGIEENVIGLKAGDTKEFSVTFPKDYHHKPLASKKATFNVVVKKVKEIKKSPLDDKLAAQVGPFKSLDELKSDIKKQLQSQKEAEAQNKQKDDLVMQLVKSSTVEVPEVLIHEQVESLFTDFKQNLVYRGITLDAYLKQNNITEEELKERDFREKAMNQVKAGLTLSEVAEKEEISVSPEEIEIRKELLKGRYKDDTMRESLEKPEAQRQIGSSLLTEKTLNKLLELNS